jgi:aarF domain-containing kinase
LSITPKVKRRRRVLLATTGVTAAVGAGAIAVGDEAKHYAAAIQRTGRVITTLAICVNELVSALYITSNV